MPPPVNLADTTLAAPACHIRWLTRKDLPAILAMDPNWTEAALLSHLSGPTTVGNVAELGRIANDPLGLVVGYIICQFETDHRLLTHLVVHAAHRRRGYGSAMLAHLVGRCRKDPRRPQLYATVAADDTAALGLLAKAGGVLSPPLIEVRL